MSGAAISGGYRRKIARPGSGGGLDPLLLAIKAVAYASDGDDLEGHAPGKLLPQPPHVHIHGLGVADVVVAPHLLQEVAARVDAARVAQEEREQVELARGQLDLLAVDGDAAGGAVENHAAEMLDLGQLGLRRLAAVAAAQHRRHPREELLQAE